MAWLEQVNETRSSARLESSRSCVTQAAAIHVLTPLLLAAQEINLAYNRMHNTTRETHQAEETCIPKEVGYMLTRLETLLLLENQLRWLPQVSPSKGPANPPLCFG